MDTVLILYKIVWKSLDKNKVDCLSHNYEIQQLYASLREAPAKKGCLCLQVFWRRISKSLLIIYHFCLH